MAARLPDGIRTLLFGLPPDEREEAPEPELLADLAAALPEALLDRALEVSAAIGLISPGERLRVLSALLGRVPTRGAEERLTFLVLRFPELAVRVPGPSVPEIVARLRQEAPGEERGRATAALAARLPGPQGRQLIMGELRDLAASGDYGRDKNLAAILDGWPEPLAHEAAHELVAAARLLGDPEARVRALFNLAFSLPGPEKMEVLQEAHRTAPVLSSHSRRVQLYSPLLSRLPVRLRDQVTEELLCLVGEMDDGPSRLLALGDMARWADDPLREQIRRQIQDASPDPRTAAQLAPFLSDVQVTDLIEALPDLGGPGEMEVLEKLMPWLGIPELERALRVLTEAPSHGSDKNRPLMMLHRHLLDHYPDTTPAQIAGDPLYRQVRMLRLSAPALLRQIPAEERLTVFREILDHIWSHYAGAPPPDEQELGAELSGAFADALSLDLKAYGEPPLAPEIGWRKMGRPHEGPPPEEGMKEEPEMEASPAPERERVVNTGFSSRDHSIGALNKEAPLPGGHPCYFWLEVGRRIPEAIDIAPEPLPVDRLPAQARLSVALFSFPGQIGVVRGKDVGELQIKPDGSVRVTRPAHEPDDLPPGHFLLDRRLFFPVTIPDGSGVYRLRCNIYCEQVLVQSHLVRVEVSTHGARLPSVQGLSGAALQTVVDYTLSASLRPEGLAALASHRLSLMLNDNGDGTHGFRFFGAEQGAAFKQDAALPGQELQTHIDKARGALRRVAWGDTTPWINQPYLYTTSASDRKFRDDLVLLAKSGYRFYVDLANRLAGGGNPAERRRARKELEALMLKPGLVQLASKVSARHIVPLALFYDYPLDTTLPVDAYCLCPDLERNLATGVPLEGTSCFQGACSSRGKDRVVCPSGFWGYRHQVGLPASVGEEADFAAAIACDGPPQLCMAVSTDPAFQRRAEHEKRLQALVPGLGWHYAQSREEALTLMKRERAHLMYFYCHGGLHEGVPYIQVGGPQERGITKDLLVNKDIFWQSQPRPLIFINGCHTTALEPEQAYDLVTGFVDMANAAGVIGTEITIFEPLAVSFAEECLAHFLKGVPIGEAVRRARLRLLRDRNPLGLVYIPFVVASLSLAAAH